MILVDQTSSGQTVDLPVGQVMEVRLTENPTTGYRWRMIMNGAPACVMVNDRFQAPSGPPGKGGEHIWLIKGAAIGTCDIAMQYRRGFEPDVGARSFALHVRVTQ